MKSLTSRTLAALALSGSLIALTACGSGGGEPADVGDAAQTGADGAQIAFLALAADSLMQTYHEALTESATPAGASVEMFSADFDPQKQQTQCQDVIAAGNYDGIVLYPVVGSLAIPCVNEAEAAGIPVVTVDSQVGPEYLVPDTIQLPGVVGQVYVDPDVYAPEFANLAKEACAGTADCPIAYFTGPATFELVNREKAALTKGIEGWGHIAFETETGYGDASKGIAAVQDLMSSGTDVKVAIVGEDIVASGVVSELQKLGSDIKVVSWGCSTVAAELIKSGQQYGCVFSTPRTTAASVMDMLLTTLDGGTPAETSIERASISPLGPGVIGVTAANIDQLTPEWTP